MPDIVSTYSGQQSIEIKDIKQNIVSGSSSFSSIKLNDKSSPDSLAEYLGTAIEAPGAVIFIKSKGEIKAISNNFYLTGLSFSFKERAQLLENFNSANVAFFGESAKVYQIQGAAIDYGSTDEGDPGKYFHQSGLIDMYNKMLRGSKLLENDSIAVLKVLNHTIEGYPISMQVGYNAGADKMGEFSIAWVVTSHTMTLDGYLNDTRLKSFYDVETMNQNNTASSKKLIRLINEFFDLQTRKEFTEEFTSEKDFFNFFGTGNTEFILSSEGFLNMFTSENGNGKPAAQAYVGLLKKYARLIGQQLDTINEDPSNAFSIHLPSGVTAGNVDNTFDVIMEAWFEVDSSAWLEKVTYYITLLANLRTSAIVYNVNRLYTPNTKLTKEVNNYGTKFS